MFCRKSLAIGCIRAQRSSGRGSAQVRISHEFSTSLRHSRGQRRTRPPRPAERGNTYCLEILASHDPELAFGPVRIAPKQGSFKPARFNAPAAVKLNPDNCYAYCKLSRCYGKLFLKTSKPEAASEQYRTLAIEMFHKAQNTPSPDVQRIGWLKDWLKQYKIHPVS